MSLSSITVSRSKARPRSGIIRRAFNLITPTLGLRMTARKLDKMVRARGGEMEVEVKKNGLYMNGNKLPWSRMVGHRLYGQIDKMQIQFGKNTPSKLTYHGVGDLDGIDFHAPSGVQFIRESMNSIILNKVKKKANTIKENPYSLSERISFGLGAAVVGFGAAMGSWAFLKAGIASLALLMLSLSTVVMRHFQRRSLKDIYF